MERRLPVVSVLFRISVHDGPSRKCMRSVAFEFDKAQRQICDNIARSPVAYIWSSTSIKIKIQDNLSRLIHISDTTFRSPIRILS